MDAELTNFPTVTIIVPCFNEEATVDSTIKSLLEMNYPRDKFNISIVDDGSTDNTWQYIEKYAGHPQIEIYKKANGGKFTALNYAIERSKADLVGCLDADSYVHKNALRRIARYFENEKVMAVVPAIVIDQPKTLVQYMQHVEYSLNILIRKVLSSINALYVTPGCFSIFRRSVFQKIGGFRHAHNAEDMEMAMRMHANHLKIENCHKGYVYTVGPKTFKTLYKQRVRWTHGSFKNMLDYKRLFFRKQYGHVAFLTLPFAVISLLSTLVLVPFIFWNVGSRISQTISRYFAVGFHLHFHFDPSFIYINTKTSLFIVAILLSMTMTLLISSRVWAEEKIIPKKILYFFFLYPIMALLWTWRSIFKIIFRRKTSWR
jgi:cellulose synthase/poly-beta-1,6-N-acetylglucosamine synthase-like glycosyltransferase